MGKDQVNYGDGLIQTDAEQRRLNYPFPDQVSMRMLSKVSPELPTAAVVVDIGAGSNGELGREVRRLGYNYTAVDTNPKHLEIQRQNGNNTLLSDARDLPIASNAVSVVHTRAVLAFLGDDDRRKVVSETLRVLRSGGFAMFAEYDYRNTDQWPPPVDRFHNILINRFFPTVKFDPYLGVGLYKSVSEKGNILYSGHFLRPIGDHYDELRPRIEETRSVFQRLGDNEATNKLARISKSVETNRQLPGFRTPDLYAVIVQKQ